MTLWFYGGAFAQPCDAQPFEDEDEEWADALAEVEVVDPRDKTKSPAVCGAEFVPGATSKSQGPDNLVAVHALVLDVDNWAERAPFSAEELKNILEGYRFIAWTTFSSTPDTPKWRIVLPLASPMPPSKFKALWRLVNEVLEGTMVEASVSDPGRLGFFGTVQSETAKLAYQWFISPGERLDWTLLDLEEEQTGFSRALEPANLSRSPDWSTDEEALRLAKRYYAKVGSDVEVGGRHETLLRASCRLWWDFAAPDAEWVYSVLSIINNNFPEPKSDEEVWKEVAAGRERVLGENRVEQPSLYGSEREPVARATKTSVKELGRSLKRQGREDSKARGRALEAIAAGHAFAEPVEARAIAMAAAAELAAAYPREQPDRLLDLMRASLQAQRAKGTTHPVPTDAEILSKIRWKQNEIRRRIEDREQARHDQQRRDISTAFGGSRDSPYTSREYREWEAEGFSDSRWILQHEREFYFFVAGDYIGPFGESAARNHARVLLSPAVDRVVTTFVDEKGKVKTRPLDELVKDYGTFVRRIEHSLAASKTTFVEEEHKLILAPLRLRPLEPCFVPEVDKFLRLFAGPHYEDLEVWLAACTALDRELSALQLITESNQGKNLLANGIARLWQTSGILSLEEATPADYEKCPVLLVDEQVPMRWKVNSAGNLRSFLSSNNRTLPRSTVEVRGFVRLIIAGNAAAKLWSDISKASDEEVEATKHRTLTIDTRGSKDAEQYLESLGGQHRAFVTQDLIAKHVLYLQERVTLPATRFVVHDRSRRYMPKSYLDPAYEMSDVTDLVGSILCKALSAGNAPGIYVLPSGDVGVATQYFRQVIEQALPPGKSAVPALRVLRKAFLDKVSSVHRKIHRGKSVSVRIHPLNLDALEAWAGKSGYDFEELEESLVNLLKTSPVGVA
jgi:hypothetical protein